MNQKTSKLLLGIIIICMMLFTRSLSYAQNTVNINSPYQSISADSSFGGTDKILLGWNSKIRIDDDPSYADKYGVKLASASNESILYAVWCDGRDDNIGKIYFSASYDGGDSWTTNLNLASTGMVMHSACNYDISVDKGGKIYVVYSVKIANTTDNFLISSIDHGNSWSLPVSFVDAERKSTRLDVYPLFISAGAEGRVYIAWGDSTYIDGSYSIGTQYDYSVDGGNSFHTDKLILADEGGLGTYLVSKFCVQGNSLFVFYRHAIWPDYQYEVIYSSDNGDSFSQPNVLPINVSVGNQYSLNVDGQGIIHAVFQVSYPDALYYIQSTDYGISFTPPSLVTRPRAYLQTPNIVVNTEKGINIILPYQLTGVDRYTSFDAGTTFTLTEEIIPNLSVFEPSSIIYGQGIGYTAWYEQNSDGSIYGIYGKRWEMNTPSQKAWTLMYYLDGDNDLSQSYVKIFNQLEMANNPDANVVVLLDTKTKGDSAYYLVQHDTDPNHFAVYQEGINKWSKAELNMGDDQTLIDFATWARQNYPAQNYALILDDHGSGLRGAMIDDTDKSGYMPIQTIAWALDQITEGGANKIDVLVLNACLMGMIEDAYQWRNYIDYYVASENIQDTYYWGYTDQVLWATSAKTPEQYAKDFAFGYTSDPGVSGQFYYTMSAADISKLNGLISAVSQLTNAINAVMNSENSVKFGNIEAQVQRFDNKPPLNKIDLNDTYVDLYDFARLVNEQYSNQQVKDAAQVVMNEINTYIIFNAHAVDKGVENSYGVSIFLPHMRSSFYVGSNYDFAAGTTWANTTNSLVSDAADIGWGQMLVNYFTLTQPNGPDDPIPPTLVTKPLYSSVYLPILIR